MCSGSHDLFNLGEITDNISETVQDKNIFTMKTNGKAHTAYQMTPMPMTLSDHEGHFCRMKPF